MIEKWEQRAIQMNFKKAVIVFLITCFVLAISVPAALYANFQSRITAWEQIRETDREHRKERKTQEDEDSSRKNERDSRENDESGSGDREQERGSEESDKKDLEEIHRYFHLSWGDLALLAGYILAGMLSGIWYWLLVMIWACRKAHRMGVNGRLAVLAALFFNLAAVAALYLYGMLKGTCSNCGRVTGGNGKFCDRCGSPLKKECPRCRQEADASSVYCSNCGKKLDENEGAKA